jgi:hypothetical protein
LASGTTQGPLPWSWYSDSELLRREQGLIFPRGLQYAGPAEHAAGPVAPAGPERTRGFLDYFFPEDVPEAEVEELLAFDDQVGLEDRALVESVQAGVRSGLLDQGAG